MHKYLETDRIYLREFLPADEVELVDLDSDPEVMKYLTNGKPSSQENIQKAMGRAEAELQRHDRKFGVWAAIEKETDAFVGWFHLFPPRDDLYNVKKLFLGYRLKRKFWGLGYATEVSAKLIEKAFETYGADEVCAQAMRANLASQKVMLKIGMTFRSNFKETSFPEGSQHAVLFSKRKEVREVIYD